MRLPVAVSTRSTSYTRTTVVIMIGCIISVAAVYFNNLTPSSFGFVTMVVEGLQQQFNLHPQQQRIPQPQAPVVLSITRSQNHEVSSSSCCTTSRRSWFQKSFSAVVVIGTTAMTSVPSTATAEFAPGGTLITDKEIGILVNNPVASPYRKYDNGNVLFDKDYYYKFGTGIQYIEPPGNTSFPKTMPFTKSQQRYDALKKYRERIVGGFNIIQSLPQQLAATTTTTTAASSIVADPKGKDDIYQLRAMGLLANGLLASENNGLPNEVFVARYYINEMYLRIDELRTITTTGTATNGNDPNNNQQQSLIIYSCIEKAANSYITLMNRVITPKVGEPLPFVHLATTALK